RFARGDFQQTLLASFRFIYLVVLTLEHKTQEPPNLNFIVNDQRDGIHLAGNTRAAAGVTSDSFPPVISLGDMPVATNSLPGSRIASLIGNRMENTAPPPGRFWATI